MLILFIYFTTLYIRSLYKIQSKEENFDVLGRNRRLYFLSNYVNSLVEKRNTWSQDFINAIWIHLPLEWVLAMIAVIYYNSKCILGFRCVRSWVHYRAPLLTCPKIVKIKTNKFTYFAIKTFTSRRERGEVDQQTCYFQPISNGGQSSTLTKPFNTHFLFGKITSVKMRTFQRENMLLLSKKIRVIHFALWNIDLFVSENHKWSICD